MGRLHCETGIQYSYRVIPVYGTSKNLSLDNNSAVEVMVTAEVESVDSGAGNAAIHDVYFNRGVIGSQAYARKFKNEKPDENNPNSTEMKWLSRGCMKR